MPTVRTTLTIDQEVVERFKVIGERQGESLSAAVSSWLKYSVETAELLSLQIEKVRSNPKPIEAMKLLGERMKAASEEYDDAVASWRKGGVGELRAVPADSAPPSTPRLVIRGVKSPTRAKSSTPRRPS